MKCKEEDEEGMKEGDDEDGKTVEEREDHNKKEEEEGVEQKWMKERKPKPRGSKRGMRRDE